MHPVLRALWLISLLALTAGCQEYEFAPLHPATYRQTVQTERIVSRQYKPNLMLVIDRSQSMDFPLENGESRWTQLRRAFGEYLTAHGTVARMGLVTFPTDDACGPGRVVADLWTQSDEPGDLQRQANAINATLQATRPGGVTPVGETLRALASYAPLESGRENIVVVATDGLPNCNPNNPNSYDVDPVACDCSFYPTSQCGGAYSRLGCLDKAGTVDAVKLLLAKGIKTAVVGFGADALQGVGPLVLNAIASEGGAPRTCPRGTDAECGTYNSCDPSSRICQMRYYQAANSKELADALATIGYDLSKAEACQLHLEGAPSDPSLISVRLNGAVLAAGPDTWTYDGAVVTFHGAACQTLTGSTPTDPARVELRSLERL